MHFKDLRVGQVLLASVKVKLIEGRGGSASVITLELGRKDVRCELSQLHLYDMRRLDSSNEAPGRTEPVEPVMHVPAAELLEEIG